MAKVPVAVKEAIKVDNNTQIPKPAGQEALQASKTGEPVKVSNVTTIPASKPAGEDTIIVTCNENGHYKFGRRWLMLLKGKKVSLPLSAAEDYKSKGKVNY